MMVKFIFTIWMSLIVCVTASCQTLLHHKESGKINGVIDGLDTLHAIPINESRMLHDFAIKKVNLEKRVKVLTLIVLELETKLSVAEKGYEALLTNSGNTA